jgi:hypothetical protein
LCKPRSERWPVTRCHAQEVTAAREPVQGLDPGVDGEMAQDAASLSEQAALVALSLSTPQFICCTQSEGTITSDSPVYLSSQLRALTQVS